MVDERDVRHWHVDYLLGHPDSTVEDVVRSPGADVECAVSRQLADGDVAGEWIPGFGASDCDCGSYLASAPERDSLLAAVERAHDRAGTVERADDSAAGSNPDRPAGNPDLSDS